MANVWENAISILAENLNSGRRYLTTTVFLSKRLFFSLKKSITSDGNSLQ